MSLKTRKVALRDCVHQAKSHAGTRLTLIQIPGQPAAPRPAGALEVPKDGEKGAGQASSSGAQDQKEQQRALRGGRGKEGW